MYVHHSTSFRHIERTVHPVSTANKKKTPIHTYIWRYTEIITTHFVELNVL